MLDFALNNIPLSDQEALRKNLLANIPEAGTDPKTLAEWEKRTAIAVVYTCAAFARRLLQLLHRLLAGAESPAEAEYRPVLTWLYYAAFLNLTKEDMRQFAHEAEIGLIFLDENYSDLVAKFKSRLSLEPMDERDLWREGVYNALHENETMLTKQYSLPGRSGTVSAWLKAYDSALGQAPVENYQLNEFISRHQLSVLEKTIVQRFFNFYEFIKLSSYDARGFEEDIFFTDEGGKRYLLADGQQIDLDAAGKTTSPQSLLHREADSLGSVALPPYADIVARSQKALVLAGGDAKAVFGIALRHIEARAVSDALAVLLLLAQLRQLDNLMEDPRFSKIVMDDLKKSGRDDNLAGIRANPTAPQYLARLLKVILEDKLGLAHEDAVAFGSRLSKILAMEGEKYQSIIKDTKWNL